MTSQAEAAALVQQQAQQWVTEASQLRREASAGMPGAGSPPPEFFQHLLRVRASLDRVEELLSGALAVRSGAQRRAKDAGNEYEDSWDQESRRNRNAGTSSGEYSTGRERQADIDLRLLQPKRAVREAERLAEMLSGVESMLRLMHRGLSDTRQDLLASLRYLSFESSIDR